MIAIMIYLSRGSKKDEFLGASDPLKLYANIVCRHEYIGSFFYLPFLVCL
jgi:hypothetical protein